MAKQGIDISYCQGTPDFSKLKNIVDFIIIQAGYGKYASQKDKTFEYNYSQCKQNGIPCGAYWFSYATSAEDAKKEALACLEVIKNKSFEYPIYYDVEGKSLTNRTIVSEMCKAFCSTLEKAGYFVGIYISRSPAQTYLTSDVANRYALWLAEYAGKLNYSGEYGMWQNSDSWAINGINGSVDHDYCYIDYPTIIKEAGLNGYARTSKTTAKSSENKSTVQTYIVRSGDTLSAIANEYNTTYQKIAAENGIKNPDKIYPGQILKIIKY